MSFVLLVLKDPYYSNISIKDRKLDLYKNCLRMHSEPIVLMFGLLVRNFPHNFGLLCIYMYTNSHPKPDVMDNGP